MCRSPPPPILAASERANRAISSPSCATKPHQSPSEAEQEKTWQTFQNLIVMLNQTNADSGVGVKTKTPSQRP